MTEMYQHYKCPEVLTDFPAMKLLTILTVIIILQSSDTPCISSTGSSPDTAL